MVDLSFPLSELEYFLLVFMRIASFVFAAPFFSTRGVPNQTKIGLSVFVAYIMYQFGPEHIYPEYNTVLGYGIIVLKEVSVGLLIGLAAQLCTSIVLFAGRIIDMEVGLSMANVFDPTTNEQSSITGVLLQYGVMLILYTTGLHRYLLKALMETFTLIPIAGIHIDTDKLLMTLITFLSNYIIIGFRICLPVFASITLMNIVLGLLAKLAPQMNMFSVGIQLKLLAGLSVIVITVTMLPDICNFISTQIQQMVVSVVEGMM
ncbi:MAG: flagellar biosynthetic protein FliR [Lachnospiraceae bacterium]|nr:flagellar biosynthetic protein FliR [Lachnospiraceae bacterium]MBO5145797.1 flagellar biosynthetic protein FliR [Lachnospiraceae bacterium]